MAVNVIMPKQGLQMTEGKITKWLADEGQKVEKGKPLFEIETDKLTIEIESPETGILLKLIKKEGDVVPVTGVIAVIGNAGEDISGMLGGEASKNAQCKDESVSRLISMEEGVPFEEESHQVESRVFSTPRARMRAEEKGLNIDSIKGTGPDGLICERDILNAGQQDRDVKATPLAKRVAELNEVELSNVQGTGSRGKITKEDVEKAADAKTDMKAKDGRAGTLIPLSSMRKVISKHMVDSLHISAQANHRISVDMTAVLELKNKLKESGVKVSITDILVKTVSKALREHRIINSTLTCEGILMLEDINIGMAVALDDGLIVPVIKNADKLSLSEISAVSSELADKAKSNSLKPGEMSEGTFTISNLGMYDLDSFTAIINQPESAILAVGKITKTYVVVDDMPVIRPVMNLCLTYDHRVIDGAPAAKFLQTLKRLIENPYLLI